MLPRRSSIAGLIALLVTLIALSPVALAVTAESWPDGITDWEPSELDPVAPYGDVAIEGRPSAVAGYEPAVMATVPPVAPWVPSAPFRPLQDPRAPPAA